MLKFSDDDVSSILPRLFFLILNSKCDALYDDSFLMVEVHISPYASNKMGIFKNFVYVFNFKRKLKQIIGRDQDVIINYKAICCFTFRKQFQHLILQ